jgi:hypothetical protein
MSISARGIYYGYGVQGAKGTAVVTTTGLRTRDEGGLSDFKSGMVPVDLSIKDGRWGKSDYSEAAGIIKPSWTGAPLFFSPGLIAPLLQQVCAETTPSNSVYKIGITGSNPIATKYLTLVRHNALATAKDKRMTDCVVKSIKLSSSESSNLVKMDVDFLAAALNYGYTPTTDAWTMPTGVPLLHKGLTFKIGSAVTQCPEYDITLDFGVQAICDNSGVPVEFLVGKFDATGTVRIPWADDDVLADFVTSVGNTLTWTWGTTGVSGFMEIIIPVKYTEPDEDIDNEIRLRQGMPFKYAQTAGAEFQISLYA